MKKNGRTVFSLIALTLAVIILCLIAAGCSDTEEGKEESGKNNKEEIVVLTDFSEAKAGDVIRFGHYEQDNNEENGPEELEGIVLDVNGKSALVISRYAIDGVYYHPTMAEKTWETCSLRKWIKETFIGAAFSEDEQKSILTVTVPAESNPDYDTDPGNDTEDKIFLLSVDEANRYFSSDEARKCEQTEYAKAQSSLTFENHQETMPCNWWLRTPGDAFMKAAIVYEDGSINTKGSQFHAAPFSFRPAMWIAIGE